MRLKSFRTKGLVHLAAAEASSLTELSASRHGRPRAATTLTPLRSSTHTATFALGAAQARKTQGFPARSPKRGGEEAARGRGSRLTSCTDLHRLETAVTPTELPAAIRTR